MVFLQEVRRSHRIFAEQGERDRGIAVRDDGIGQYAWIHLAPAYRFGGRCTGEAAPDDRISRESVCRSLVAPTSELGDRSVNGERGRLVGALRVVLGVTTLLCVLQVDVHALPP